MAKVDDGEPRISASRKSIIDAASQVDARRFNTALITFDTEKACEAKVAVPPSNNDPDEIVKALDSVGFSDRTPLAAALALSAAVLQDVDKKMLVVFSDGRESCNGDPVRQARILNQKYGIKVNMQVIGYAVDASVESHLRKIAEVNDNWGYHGAADGKELKAAVAEIAREGDLLDPQWLDVNTFSFQFESGSAQLTEEYSENIAKIHGFLKRNQRTITIYGHTDSVGSEDENLELSVHRANMVKERLIDMGLDPSRIKVVGEGEAEPVSSNDTDAGRRKNRRVVILIH